MKTACADRVRRTWRDARGFTLIEVMVAVVVLAVGISSIMVFLAQATKMVSTARGATVQTMLARQVMVEIENKYWRKQAQDIETSGTFGSEFPNYRYEVTIIENIDVKVPELQQVSVTVYWNRGGYERPYTLTTYLIDFSK